MTQKIPLNRKQDPLRQPVLGTDELMVFLNQGLAQKVVVNNQHRQSSLNRSGAHLSTFRGSGFDYDDSRAYQPGDDLRNINWRLMARTSELFTKIYREEREASMMLVIDRRSSMRFGTRSCLKVTRAVQISAFLAGIALSQSYSVGFTLLQTNGQSRPPQRHKARVIDGLMGAASACPPVAAEGERESLSLILKRLILTTPVGSRLFLLSDFHDIKEADAIMLHHLASQHQVLAIQILDPVELALPNDGVWLLDQFPGGTPLQINANDASVKQQYQHAMLEHQALIVDIFAKCHIPLIQAQTDTAMDEIMRQLAYA